MLDNSNLDISNGGCFFRMSTVTFGLLKGAFNGIDMVSVEQRELGIGKTLTRERRPGCLFIALIMSHESSS
jgi:hypothetical protein